MGIILTPRRSCAGDSNENQQLSQASDSEQHSIRTQEKKGRHTRRENNKIK